MDDVLGVKEEERADLSGRYHAYLGQLQSLKAAESLYPNRASPPLPAPLPASKLAGTYLEAGYGHLHIREAAEDDQDKTGEQQILLVADRSDAWLRHQMRFEHVSGDHWIMHVVLVDNPGQINLAFPAAFKVGVGGSVEGVNVDFKNPGIGMDDGSAFFKREGDV